MSIELAARSQFDYELKPLHLVEEISHRVVNEYTEAVCSLNLAASSTTDPDARETLIKAAGGLRARAEAHRALQAPVFGEQMDLTGYIARVCASMAKARLTERRIQLTVRGDEACLEADRCWRVGLIVAELVNNAERHGYFDGPGAVWVDIDRYSGEIICRVSDNGHGVGNGRLGRGKRIVQALAAELGGIAVWRFAPDGCYVQVRFPIAQPLLDPIALLVMRTLGREP
jgi:two-component sensor histidine kinase